MSVERLQKELGVQVKWIAFPLHPETPKEGKSLAELFKGRGLDVAAVVASLQKTASGFGLEFGDRTMTYNTRRAQELGKWAEQMGQGHEFHLAAFRAYFVDGLNLALDEVLLPIVESLGLDEAQARRALDQGLYADAVDADWEYARRCKVQAVPSFKAGDRMVVGCKPYPELAALFEG